VNALTTLGYCRKLSMVNMAVPSSLSALLGGYTMFATLFCIDSNYLANSMSKRPMFEHTLDV